MTLNIKKNEKQNIYNTSNNSVKVSRLHSEEPKHIISRLEKQNESNRAEVSNHNTKINFIFSGK